MLPLLILLTTTAVAESPVVSVATVADLSEANADELVRLYEMKHRQRLTQPTPVLERELLLLALRLADVAPEREVLGRPVMEWGAEHAIHTIRLQEVRSLEARPPLYYNPSWDLLSRLASAGGFVRDGERQTAWAVDAALRMLAARLATAPSEETEGVPGAFYRSQAQLAVELLDLEPGNTWLASALWRAEALIAQAWGGEQEPFTQAADLLDLAERAAASERGRRRVLRTTARRLEQGLGRGWVKNIPDAGARLEAAALGSVELVERPHDQEVGRWVGLSYELRIKHLLAHGEFVQVREMTQKMLSPPISELLWPTRESMALGAALHALLGLEATLGEGLSLSQYRQEITLLEGLIQQSFSALRLDRLGPLDAEQHALLVQALSDYGSWSEHRGRQDVAALARSLRDSLPPPVADAVGTTEAAAPPPLLWLPAHERMLDDVRTLALLARSNAAESDRSGQRHLNRVALLRQMQSLLQELAVRASLQGPMGQDFRRSYIQAQQWMALAHAASGDPGGAAFLLRQVTAQDSLALDAPLWEGRTATELCSVWATEAEVRPLLLQVPNPAPSLEVRGEVFLSNGLQHTNQELAEHARPWFPVEAEPGTDWLLASLPATLAADLPESPPTPAPDAASSRCGFFRPCPTVDDVPEPALSSSPTPWTLDLVVDGQALPLPPGEAPVVYALEDYGGWVLTPLPTR